jgi:hypothetical protein
LVWRVFADNAYSRKPQIADEINGYSMNVQNVMDGKFAEMWQTDSEVCEQQQVFIFSL